MRFPRLNQQGDTIVEVLIAIAIVSTVLAGAFTVTQRSALGVRSSQEHGEMLQILQAQVEQVRSLALESPDTVGGIFDVTPQYFCIDPSTGARVNFSGAFTLPNLSPGNFDYADYPGACRGIQDHYNVAIRYIPATETFQFNGRWDKLGGGKSQEQLIYRVYPNQ